MRIVLQRVNRASVKVSGETVGSIEKGLLLLVGFAKDDIAQSIAPLVEKILNMRVFPDDKGRFHFSVRDIAGGVLAVPQFTLFADTSKGRRPEFFSAMEPEKASQFFDQMLEAFRAAGVKDVQSGRFGAYMQVELENDGPVTIIVEG